MQHLEQTIEDQLDRGIERAEQSIARALGARALHWLILALRTVAWLAIGTVIAAGSLMLITRYWLLPTIDQWRPKIEAAAGEALGVPVTIGRVEASWTGLNPRAALNDVRIADHTGGSSLALPRVEAIVSWYSLIKMQPHFARLRILSPEVGVALLSGDRISVAGFVIDPQAPTHDDGNRAVDWLLAQGEVIVSDARVLLRDARSDTTRELQFDNLNLTLLRGWGSHRFGLKASAPSSISAPIELRGRFRHPPFERSSDFTQWRGELYAQVDYIDLAQLNQWVQTPLQVGSAFGALRTWVRFDRAELVQVTADVALKDVVVRFARDLEPLRMSSLQGRLAQQRWGNPARGGQALSATQLTFTTVDGRVFPPLDLSVRTTRPEDNRPQQTEVSASRIDLATLAVVATHVPVAREARELISRHAVRGQLSDVSMSWDGPQPQAQTMSLKMGFSGLVSAAQFGRTDAAAGEDTMPGFENLSGTIELARGAGRLQLASRDTVLIFPGVFEQPRLAFAQLSGSVQWKSTPRLEVHIDSLAASNADLELNASGDWRQADAGAGVVDLNVRLPRLAAPSVYRYVPQGVGTGTLGWLQHALVAGQLSNGSIRVRGDLRRFPFVQPADGEFRATGRMRDATLDVAPASGGTYRAGSVWPLLSGIDADLVFERNGMTITADRGQAQSARIDRFTARIASFSESMLEIRGQVSGALADMLRYVNASPIAHSLGGLTTGAVANGSAKLDLGLDIPLGAPDRTRVNASLQLPGNDVALAGVPPFTRLTGTVVFTERGVSFQQLIAGFIGGNCRFEAQTRNDNAIVLNATGTMTPAGLRPIAELPVLQRLLDRAQGTARYTATLTIARSGNALVVESDLVGLAIEGVAPLRKAANEPLPLRIDRNWAEARDEFRVAAGKLLAIRLEQQRRDGKDWQLTRGVIAVNEPANLPNSGLQINVNVPRLDVDALTGWLGDKPAADAPSVLAMPAAGELNINLLTLRTPELLLMQRTFRNVNLSARTTGGGLDVNVTSDAVAGHVVWRPGATGSPDATGLGRVSAQLTKLSIPLVRKGDAVGVRQPPSRQLPAIDLVVDNFELGDAKFGRLELSAQNSGIGNAAIWRLRRMNISNPDMKLNVSGDWQPVPGGGRRMAVKFALDTGDAGNALTRFGYRNMMTRGQGNLNGDLDWLGSPFEIDYDTLGGKLQLKLENGRFTRVEAGNAARLLSLLSLQSLSRSLGAAGGAFAEGFAFNSIQSDTTIARGVMTIPEMRMVSQNAAVVMSGNINLNTETQQLHLLVLPEVDASTAALALTVVNPVIGLGTWLAQTVFRDPLSKVFAIEYDISGTWADPVVTRRGGTTAANSNETLR